MTHRKGEAYREPRMVIMEQFHRPSPVLRKVSLPKGMKCSRCGADMVGPVPVSIQRSAIADPIVSPNPWRVKGSELVANGYYCPKCGNMQVTDEVVVAQR
jgi:hypothetical protein